MRRSLHVVLSGALLYAATDVLAQTGGLSQQVDLRRIELSRIGCASIHQPRECVGSQVEYYQSEPLINVKAEACHPDRAKAAIGLLNAAVQARKADANSVLSHTVLDLGSGCGDLRPLLNASELDYLPTDLRERYFPVIQCDLNRGDFPRVRRPALVVALGVIEYMCDAVSFLRAVRDFSAPFTLFSHTPLEANGPLYRRLPLANNMTRLQLATLLEATGFRVHSQLRLHMGNLVNDVYLLEPMHVGNATQEFFGEHNEQVEGGTTSGTAPEIDAEMSRRRTLSMHNGRRTRRHSPRRRLQRSDPEQDVSGNTLYPPEMDLSDVLGFPG